MFLSISEAYFWNFQRCTAVSRLSAAQAAVLTEKC